MIKTYTKEEVINAVDMALVGRIGGDEASIILKDVLGVLEKVTVADVIEGSLKKELDMDDSVDQDKADDEWKRQEEETRLYNSFTN